MRQSFAHFRIALYAPVLAGMLLASGCASLPPPTAELDAARQAVLRAESADADQYAAEALQAARASLQRAQEAMARGRDDEARAAALSAAGEADQARVRSNAARTRAELLQKRAEIAAAAANGELPPLPFHSHKVRLVFIFIIIIFIIFIHSGNTCNRLGQKIGSGRMVTHVGS